MHVHMNEYLFIEPIVMDIALIAAKLKRQVVTINKHQYNMVEAIQLKMKIN